MLQLRNAPDALQRGPNPAQIPGMSDHPPHRPPPVPEPETEPDRIHLRDHVVAVEVGAFADERDRTQRLRFAVDAALAHAGRGAGDDVDRILSYDVLVGAVAGALAGRRFDLLEAIAEDVAARVLAHPAAGSVRVTVEKLDRVPGALGVTITRGRGGAPQQGRAADLEPIANVSSAASQARPAGAPPPPVLAVADWIARRASGAAVLVPALSGLPLPATGAREQLLLLALDQGAWAAAGALDLDVAATRTEMLAATSAGRAVVWAPARMVREAADLAPADRTSPEALARWLTARLG